MGLVATGRGRLTADREVEVYAAVVAELLEAGYERFNYDNVASRARCSKATLYRLWDDKADLVSHAILCHDEPPPAVDRGSLRADLHAWAEQAVDDRFAQLVLVVTRAAMNNPELAAAVRTRLFGDAEASSGPVDPPDDFIGRAVARGEIDPENPALQHVGSSLIGMLAFHELLTGRRLTAPDLQAYIDAVIVPALTTPSSNRS